jgi:hypothetical protein
VNTSALTSHLVCSCLSSRHFTPHESRSCCPRVADRSNCDVDTIDLDARLRRKLELGLREMTGRDLHDKLTGSAQTSSCEPRLGSCNSAGRASHGRRGWIITGPRGEGTVSAGGNGQIVSRYQTPSQGVACPKCGSSRTAVTVSIEDDSVNLTLYSCGTCDHRFSRTGR